MIRNLFFKPERYKPVVSASELSVSPKGIHGSVHAEPIRHVLIVPQRTLSDFGLQPGDLRENVVIDDTTIGDLHSLLSGTVLALGEVLIRLTIHCEPCPRLSHLVADWGALKDRRGYLGTFLTSGTFRIDDRVVQKAGVSFEPIPFDLRERIAWYLQRQESPVPVTKFVRDVGLSLSYCRAVPNLLKGIPGAKDKILFGQGRRSIDRHIVPAD
jgi:MOSC domain-containing protein YiiM